MSAFRTFPFLGTDIYFSSGAFCSAGNAGLAVITVFKVAVGTMPVCHIDYPFNIIFCFWQFNYITFGAKCQIL